MTTTRAPRATLRIGFNARLLRDPQFRGWNRYTIDLLRELPGQGVHPILYAQEFVHEDYLRLLPEGSYTVVVAPAMAYTAWLGRWLPSRLRDDRADLIHSPFNFGLPPTSPCPRVMTLHDAIEIAHYGIGWSAALRKGPGAIKAAIDQRLARSRAHRILTVSEVSKADIVRYYGVRPERVSVTPEAAAASFHAPIPDEERQRVRRAYGLPSRYVFYVGGWEGRKNIPFLLRAFAEAGADDLGLVLAGGKADEQAELTRLAGELGIADRLRLIGWVAEADLPALYAEAHCFAYPSLYEGFGLQLCEAMAAGCPTLAARATSLPEVLGDGGETFDPTATPELAGLLRRVASEPAYRDALAARARRRSRDFSWARTAVATVAVYRELIRPRPARGGGTSPPAAEITR